MLPLTCPKQCAQSAASFKVTDRSHSLVGVKSGILSHQSINLFSCKRMLVFSSFEIEFKNIYNVYICHRMQRGHKKRFAEQISGGQIYDGQISGGKISGGHIFVDRYLVDVYLVDIYLVDIYLVDRYLVDRYLVHRYLVHRYLLYIYLVN